MTREELSELRESSKNDDQVVEILFDKLNDIESRVCGNCEFYINNEYRVGCSRLGLNYNQPTFGCNEFVGKVESK